ncbi:MAG: SDR family NAD(P)-dependent oxidoreductase [Actinomycetota bacterium]|nr:SDR family NAD(P)-dependent oxidoreductase [Actinomycetota bacterium]
MRAIDEATVLVTGATDGLGRQVAQDLAGMGATVLVHGRDRGRADAVVSDIRDATGNDRARSHLADLSSLDEVRALAREVEDSHDRLDVLINNAGIGPGGRGDGGRAVSRDGHELRFAVNYLAGFLLTRLLLPLLERSAPARVVNVASAGQSAIDFDDVMLERRYDGMRAYAQSKLAQVMFTFELAERLEGTGVTATCLHPATLMDTKMVTEAFGRARSSIREGADATVRLAAAPELAEVSGRYFEGLREAGAHHQAYDREARRRLWALSEQLCGLEPPATAGAAGG